ncbi:MAG: hypothetical protein AUI62_03850 [Thaumarchaeota archaeon 13_1_40CM_2_39_7]|nr:MAG: hypothetical protein AUI62_03850 [Thaumarchaeota archaeon 13_1_40CM_2_39_7]
MSFLNLQVVWFYSLLSATIGDIFDAFHAGYNPAPILRITESAQTFTISAGRNIGVTCAAPGGPGVKEIELRAKPAPIPASAQITLRTVIPLLSTGM